MVTVAALEAIRTGTTTVVQNAGRHRQIRAALAQKRMALRVRGVDSRQRERRGTDVARWTREKPDADLSAGCATKACADQRLFTAWHGKNQGRIRSSPPPRSRRPARPNWLTRSEVAEQHEPGYPRFI